MNKYLLSMLWGIISMISGAETYANDNTAEAEQSKAVIELTTEQFNKLVFNTKSDKLVYLGKLPAIVDFTAVWCGPCRQTAPVLEDIAKEYAGKILVYKVDVDKCGQIAQAMGISSIPAIMYIPANGKEPVMTVGARGKDRFRSEISKYLLNK